MNENKVFAEVTEVVSEAEVPVEETTKKGRKKKHRRKLYEINTENDIKYRGPLSYRHLRMFGWFFLAVAQIAVILRIGSKASEALAASSAVAIEVLSNFSYIMMPLFLLANFSMILRSHANFKRIIIQYVGLTLGFAGGYLLIYEHYVVGFTNIFVQDITASRQILDYIYNMATGSGMKTLNVFLDLLLCTMLYFFLIYHPKKFFQGKKIAIFRLFAILPVAYEIASMTLKFLKVSNVIAISPYAYPFLTCKPPLCFVAFIAITLFFAFRKKYFIKHGVEEGQYHEFLKTNANSWQVSSVTSIIFAGCAVIDLVLLIILAAIFYNTESGNAGALAAANAFQIGDSMSMVVIIPLVLLFSYTREHKNALVDILVPIAGIGLIAFVYLEGLFQLSKMIPDLFQKIIDKITGGGA